jgi:uncharacterized protein (TIGR00159 family)
VTGYLWNLLVEFARSLVANFDPLRDPIDIFVVAFGVYWLLLLIKGTRAVQMLVGLLLLIGVSAAAQVFQLATLLWILDHFLASAVVILIVLFQNDIRRALARVGRGFFPAVTDKQESQIAEEVVRAAQSLAQKRVGALIVLERDTRLDDHVETGTQLDAVVSKEQLISLFIPLGPLHDGAALIQNGRISYAGCVLPLSLRQDLPEGLGTRHRAAVGITEETDAAVVVVSEEKGTISVVVGGEMIRDLDGPRLRVVLRDVLAGERADAAREAAQALPPGGAGPEGAGGPGSSVPEEEPRHAAVRRA